MAADAAQEKWLPIGILATVDHQSAYYNEADKAGIFYAESWALMHMLYFDPRYRENFDRFVLALAGGRRFCGRLPKDIRQNSPANRERFESLFQQADRSRNRAGESHAVGIASHENGVAAVREPVDVGGLVSPHQ